ncbi:uroporphyrinogen-III synthase, partial [Methylobacterium oryzihabitans]
MTGPGEAEADPLRVWVARPLPAGGRSAARLAALGHVPLLAPVLAVAPGDAPPPAGPVGGGGLTRAHAAGARAAGRGPVLREAGGDAAALAALIASDLSPGARLLHAAGRERKPEPA